MKKIIHILPHNIYKFFPQCRKNITYLSEIDHHITRFIRNCIAYDEKSELTHELRTIWDVDTILEVVHNQWFIIKVFPQDFQIFLPLETPFSIFKAIKNELKIYSCKRVWHIHSYYLFMFDLLVLYLKYKWEKIFAHHRWWWFTYKALPYSLYKYVFILPIILRFCEKIFVQNKTEYDRLNTRYKINKNKLISFPNSILKQREKTSFLKNYTVHIVFIGRLEKIKGISDILNALYFLQQRGQVFDMTFIWEGSMRSKIEDFCKKYSIQYTITWWIDPSKLDTLLQEKDICVIANKKAEGSSNAVLEALAYGLPVISYDIEWINDFVESGKSGFLVNSQDEFNNKLFDLVSNPLLIKTMSSFAQKDIQARFNQSIFFKTLIDHYYESIHSSNRNSR